LTRDYIKVLLILQFITILLVFKDTITRTTILDALEIKLYTLNKSQIVIVDVKLLNNRTQKNVTTFH